MVRRSVIVLAVALGFASAAWAGPPRVVRAEPDMGDAGVDPAVAEIRVTFDQDMAPGAHSICGGGPTFPKMEGKPSWADARTLVLPVKLEPGKTYALSANCPGAKNCRGVNGESARPYPILFRTRGAGEKAPAALDDKEAAAAVEELREAMEKRYSYADLRGVDWKGAFEKLSAEVKGARSPAEVARAMARMLSANDDPHVSVVVNGFTIGTSYRDVEPNWNVPQIAKIVTGYTKRNNRVGTGMMGDVPYVLIADWTGTEAEYAPVQAFIDEHIDAKGMVIDVRPNGGGDELLARAVAERFVSKPTVYARSRTRDPDVEGGWTKMFERTVQAAAEGKLFKGRVVVLMGPANMSSNESFLQMMRHGAGAKLIGERSRGSSGNPRPHDVGVGITVRLPSWKDVDADGAVLEGKGIEPDRVVKFAEGKGGSDAVLEAGVEEVRK